MPTTPVVPPFPPLPRPPRNPIAERLAIGQPSISVRDLAALIGVSYGYVAKQIREGRLKAGTVGHHHRVSIKAARALAVEVGSLEEGQ